MKRPASGSSYPTVARETARKRKQCILGSIPCFWFVVGTMLVVYARHLAESRTIFLHLRIPQFHQLASLLALAALITFLIFGYWWLRFDHIERELNYSVIQALLGLAFTWAYLHETNTGAPFRVASPCA